MWIALYNICVSFVCINFAACFIYLQWPSLSVTVTTINVDVWQMEERKSEMNDVETIKLNLTHSNVQTEISKVAFDDNNVYIFEPAFFFCAKWLSSYQFQTEWKKKQSPKKKKLFIRHALHLITSARFFVLFCCNGFNSTVIVWGQWTTHNNTHIHKMYVACSVSFYFYYYYLQFLDFPCSFNFPYSDAIFNWTSHQRAHF